MLTPGSPMPMLDWARAEVASPKVIESTMIA
jgi:hypothetical protein